MPIPTEPIGSIPRPRELIEGMEAIGVHTCPGGDQDSTHSADVDYADLLPDLFTLRARTFYIQLASEMRCVLGARAVRNPRPSTPFPYSYWRRN